VRKIGERSRTVFRSQCCSVNVSDFDFDLPPGAIAQRPAPRGMARLMTLDRASGATGHSTVAGLPDLLCPGDLLVLNDTKVIPARLFGKDEMGRRTEFLLVRRLPKGAETADESDETWECLARPGRRVRPNRRFFFEGGLTASALGASGSGQYLVSFSSSLEEFLPRFGTTPLPPYIRRPEGVADARDREDYQTVYATFEGSIAAPTAGLHFTRELLSAIESRGALLARVTLHVGLGTFKPVKVERVEEHVMDVESGTIPEAAAEAIARAKAEKRRVVAVGTTTVRALEGSARAHKGRVAGGPFATELFLTPGATFQVVDALLTNFHLPRSTLLMLVSAFAGRENVLAAYRQAVTKDYRFFSYGDAMFIS
jgi:S-adenosylmethionine:tRNA ribosyltransferase-isomerase